MTAVMMPVPEMLSALLGALDCRHRLHGGVDIVEFAQEDKEAARHEQGPHAFLYRGQHDRTRDGLKAAHDADDSLEAVTADMSYRRKIENQVNCAIIRRCFHQLIQFTSLYLVDIALRAKDGNRSVAFNGYRHGYVDSLARDDCRCALMKVHLNSI